MNNKLQAGLEGLIQYIKVFALAALGFYLYPAIIYLIRHFSDFVRLETNAIKYVGSIIAQMGLGSAATREILVGVAGVTIIIPIVLAGLAFIVFCLWLIYQLIVKQEKWLKEFHEVWQEVGKCHWWDSVWDFFKCLGGVLYALVYTIVWVLLIIFSIIIVLINIIGVISLP